MAVFKVADPRRVLLESSSSLEEGEGGVEGAGKRSPDQPHSKRIVIGEFLRVFTQFHFVMIVQVVVVVFLHGSLGTTYAYGIYYKDRLIIFL